MSKKHYIIPIFIPHIGCPFDCVFCNQRKITGFDLEPNADFIDKQISRYYETIPDPLTKNIEIAFYGGSFTGIKIEKQMELLSVANSWKINGFINEIRISTRPDYIDNSTLELLKNFGVSIIELGVQSMDDQVLEKSERGHTAMDVIRAVKIIKNHSLKLGLQMMLGLPGATYEKDVCTSELLITLNPDFVRIYPTLVIKNTSLEKQFIEGKYKPLTLYETIAIAKVVLIKFQQNNIPVIRIGIQPTEELLAQGDVIAGPFHPSIRQLVESAATKDFLTEIFSQLEIKEADHIVLQTNNRFLSLIVGHKKNNIDYLKKKFMIRNIEIITNNVLPDKEIIISYNAKQELFDYNQFINNIV